MDNLQILKLVKQGKIDREGSQGLTGYPHIDKPWLKYYDEEFLKKPLPQMSIYDYMRIHNIGNEESVALSYYGNEITYGELYDKIESSTKVLTSLGVCDNDRILYLMPNIPETAYLFYGGSRIGAVSDYVDPRPDSIDLKVSARKILELIKKEKIKHIVALDMCYLQMIKPIENELKEMGIDDIIITSASNSMDLKAKLNYLKETLSFDGLSVFKNTLKNQKKISEKFEDAKRKSPLNLIDFNKAIHECKGVSFMDCEYIGDRLSVITHTSGTSGAPKPIPLTTYNLNAYVHQTYGANMLMEKGDRVLHILPYFAAYGVVDVAHAGLVHGNNLIQIPMFSPANLGKLIKKYKPQTIIGVPSWLTSIMNSKELSSMDLSFIKMLTYGGDSMNAEDEEKVNDFLREHNCNCLLTKGHGMSEIGGCGSYATNEYNVPSSMGIPMPNTTYAIVDFNTKKPIQFDLDSDVIEGEIAISSPVATSGNLDGIEFLKKIDLDGKDFILTGDIAAMDKDGILHYLTRADRTFTRYDGFKVKPYKIEEMIKSHFQVKECVITSYYDERVQGMMPTANIVLENGDLLEEYTEEEICRAIIEECFVNNKEASSRQIPSKFRFLKELPLTKNGKIDYNNIESTDFDLCEIDVVCDETNILLGDIKIHKRTRGKVLQKNRK